MSETIKTHEHYYTKEFGRYYSENPEDNFVANQELTVEITLNEYRKLIKENAESSSKLSNERSESSKLRNENEKLEEELKELKNKVYVLQNPSIEGKL
ncbi:hypothetical protein [Staphylococcus equorum]|uniref:Uncharacterized protein n=1 Tax=Staphylococcus equorum TaxID=246432 RepID=A0A9X4LD28_9STAP|nr:hypothetical protein [Staphylococcus equorum]MDG0860357.1 hypothetical protein [Staphylococcus equorum]